MPRLVLEPETLEEVSGFVVEKRTRFVFKNPRRSGPALRDVRAVLAPKGRLRFTATPARLFADLDPGHESPLVALDMIVRSDARGLERALLSALSEADEIVIGIDGRSDEATREVAEAYADKVWTFNAADIGLTEEEWLANRIHFANARNLGREKVQAPWVLILDSDEYLFKVGTDLRGVVRGAEVACGSFSFRVNIGGLQNIDGHRLALTKFRWIRASHNQLVFPPDSISGVLDVEIMHDTQLREECEVARRALQRDGGIDQLMVEADAGDLNALFHVAKHRIGEDKIEEALKLSDRFRKAVEVRGPAADERAHLAVGMGILYYDRDDFVEAELWALRALLDGPRIEAFCLLGDVAEDRGDLKAALVWYGAACATSPSESKVGFSSTTTIRWGRYEGIRRALAEESAQPVA